MSVSDRLEYRAQEPPPGKGRNPDLVNDGAHKPPGAHGVYASSEKELGEEVLEGGGAEGAWSDRPLSTKRITGGLEIPSFRHLGGKRNGLRNRWLQCCSPLDITMASYSALHFKGIFAQLC